ncbi:MAG TPA: bifunctional oligoribonuclease/PAP phosphatase NrnA [Pirellulales bacterium]|jgi:phosphoesterase RecJ-like protein|nr:bifunctional oligoribonuclease/PAP phosphatase NrnA [Pirellulales bacterium]
MSINWPRFVEVIKAHERFLLVSHIRPDCDALGSELGMASILDALGKRVRIVNGQATPPNYRFIDPHRRIQTIHVEVQPADLNDVQVLMILDTSAWAQLGPMSDVVRATPAKKIVLDHHVSADDLGAELFKNTEAEATGRLVLEAAQHLGVRLTPEIATPLFAAIATDTGWFRFASTRGDTFRAGGALIDAGAKPTAIFNALYEQETLARLNLTGRILTGAKSELDGRFIYTAVRQDDFKATGAIPSDTEDIINMTLNVAGTQMAVILVEQPSGDAKVSFRSRCAVDCSKLAEQFGGGGHKAAAGAFVKGPFEQAQAKVLDAVRAVLK